MSQNVVDPLKSLKTTLNAELDKLVDTSAIEFKIKQKQHELDMLLSTIDITNNQYEQRKSKQKNKLDEVTKLITDKLSIIEEKERIIIKTDKDIKQLTENKKDCEDTIEALKSVVESVNQQITERNEYLVEQEELITNSINTGNESLLAIKYEMQDIERQKSLIKVELEALPMLGKTLLAV